MFAVYVNCAAVIAGSLVGLFFAKKLGALVSAVVPTAAGAVTLVLGVQMALGYGNIVYLALSVIIGGLVGTALKIEEKIEGLGKTIEGLLSKWPRGSGAPPRPLSTDSRVAKAFLNASVLFCVGAMSFMGSLKAGLDKDYSIILTKSVLDGFMAIGFAAAMGVGTAFSAVSVLVVQGAITLSAGAISAVASEQMLAEVSASGGILVLMISLNLLGLQPLKTGAIKTGNYLPALLVSAILVALEPLWKPLLAP
jgi:uncharacterized membrane protein YqgA involved in biofilm formation